MIGVAVDNADRAPQAILVSDLELKELVATLAEEHRSLTREHKEIDRQLADALATMAKARAETERALLRLEGSVGMQFGRFVEAIVASSCLRLFQERGGAVNQSMRRVQAIVDGRELELEILLVNGNDVVLVEVKSACRARDVRDVLEDLGRFRQGFAHYAKHRLYGAVAGLEFLAESARFAARQGLFVLQAAGGQMEITNRRNFRARQF